MTPPPWVDRMEVGVRQAQAVSKLVNERMHDEFTTPLPNPFDGHRLDVLGNLR